MELLLIKRTNSATWEIPTTEVPEYASVPAHHSNLLLIRHIHIYGSIEDSLVERW